MTLLSILETIENAVENLCYLIIVTYKFYKKLSSVAKMVEILVDQFGSKLIEQIVQSFASIILEAEPNDEEDENDTLTREDIITAQLQLMRLLMFKIHHLNKFHWNKLMTKSQTGTDRPNLLFNFKFNCLTSFNNFLFNLMFTLLTPPILYLTFS